MHFGRKCSNDLTTDLTWENVQTDFLCVGLCGKLVSLIPVLSSVDLQKHPCNSKEAVFGEIRSACRVCVFAGRPVMIVVEYMENGSLDSFLRVSAELIRELKHVYVCS